MRIGIYGAGSLGTALGAYLSKKDVPVELINHNAAHVEALNSHGARVTGTAEFTANVAAITPEQMEGEYDILFLLTKQLNNPAIAAFLKPHLKDDGVLCTMQNGLPEPGLVEILGENRVVGCTVAWGAELLEPGVVKLTSDPDSMTFGMGSTTGDLATIDKVKAVLENMCPVEVENNFMGVRFSKLLINAAFSGMSIVTGGSFGEVAGDRHARKYTQLIIKECLDVAKAANIKIEPVQGKDIAKLLDYNGVFKKWISFQIIPIAIKKHALIKASMLRDLARNRKTEIDAINGVVCEFGKKYGVKTPVNDKVVKLVHDMENGRGKPSFENVKLLAAY
ncbi:2-dehydropantoate 2-reductase [Christensenellaceae bacterium OttesenSCG-928-M15]|nr:2-dehydropantoate 2-reductase [Christensenellaceae bacterium OttesenSCG-928-M15]